MHLTTITKAAQWRQPTGKRASFHRSTISLLSILLVLAVSARGLQAIVKIQQQQQAQPQQQQQQQPQQQQQRSDESASVVGGGGGSANGPSGGYNNHQAPLSSAASNQQQQVSGSAAAQNSQAMPMQQGGSLQQSGRSSLSQMEQAASYQSSNGNNNQKAYMDNMAAAASNPEQSYQAAAQSVNMALASSGIFNSNGAGGYQPSAQQQQQPQQVGNSGGQGGASANSLNPLHYFYYPAKDNSQQQQVAPNKQQQQADMMANSAGAYPSYADQLSSALSSLGAASPEAAASNQDASYLPQPMDASAAASHLYPPPNNNNNNQHQQMPQQMSNAGQQQATYSDLGAYASNSNVQSVSSANGNSISFSGPASSGGPMANQAQPNDYSHMAAAMGQQQQQPSPQQQQQGQSAAGVPPVGGYPNSAGQGSSLFGDLSTSNYGNSGAANLASVASYMSPSGVGGQHSPAAQEMYANSLLNGQQQQFNSAASQLAPAAVAPPPQQQQQQQQQAGLYAPLYGGAQQQQASQASQQQHHHQANNLFGGHYLNSLFTPQQLSQFNQQMGLGSGGDPSQLMNVAASSPSSSSIASLSPQSGPISAGASTSSTSKRFGISSFIMPMLALAGLSLLIPTMSNIGTAVGRKKRSVVEERAGASHRQQQIAYEPMLNGAGQVAKEGAIGEYLDKIERYYSMYKNVVESDECLNRLICEFGDAVKDVTGKSAVVTVIEKLVPQWMTGKMHLFRESLMDNKEGKEKCKKYACHSASRHH